MSESNKRSILKAVSYRIFGSLFTFGAAYLFTQSVADSTVISVLDFFAKTLLYYVHERFWNRIKV